MISLFLINSCSTAPDFDRLNENDPSSGSFIPDTPSKVGVSSTFKNNGDIQLNWKDNTENEDGYRVYKSIGSDENFELVTELENNATAYLDTTKTMKIPLRYRVVSFTNSNESKPLEIEIDFGGFSKLNLNTNSSIKEILLNWHDETEINSYALIEYSYDNSNWYKLDTLQNGESSYKLNYSNFESFDLYVRVSSIFKNFENEVQLINILSSEKISIHESTNFRVETIFEDEVSFSWDDNLDFETGFKIIHKVIDDPNIYNEFIVGSNITSLQTVITPSPRQHTFSLVALKNSLESEQRSIRVYNYAYIEKNALNFQQINNEEIKISWSKILNARKLQVERSINSSDDFEVYSLLEGEETSFTDSEINSENSYSYRIKSLTHSSNSLTIKYAETLEYEKTIGLDDHFIIKDGSSDSNQFFYIKKDQLNNQLILERRDIETNGVTNRILEDFEGIDRIELSPNNEFIAVYGIETSGIRIWNLKVYQNTEFLPLVSTFQNISNGIESFTFSHDSEQILILDYDGSERITSMKVLNVLDGTVERTEELSKRCLVNIIRHPESKKYILDCSSSYEILDTTDFTFSTLYDKATGNRKDEYLVENFLFTSTAEYPIIKIDLMSGVTEIIESNQNYFLTVIPNKNQFLMRYDGLKILDGASGETYFIDIDFLVIKDAIYNEESDRVIALTFDDSIEILKFNDKWSLRK